MEREHAVRRRRRWPVVRMVAAVGLLVWFVSPLSLPSAEAVAPAGPAPAEVAPLCPGCKTFALDVPVDPTDATTTAGPNSTLEIDVRLPAGWSGLACADQYGVVARTDAQGGAAPTAAPTAVPTATATPAFVPPAAGSPVTAPTAGPVSHLLPVSGWQCTVPALNRVHFEGRRAAWEFAKGKVPFAADRFLFRALSPGPVENLSAGFIELTQVYLDGEQQLRRGLKQIEATAPNLVKNAVVDLPRDWIGSCDTATSGNARVGGKTAFPVSGWTCTPVEGTGNHPRFRLSWQGGDPARFFYFDAHSRQDTPDAQPLTLVGVTKLKDRMYENGRIRTGLVAYLHPALLAAMQTQMAAAAATATPSPTDTSTPAPVVVAGATPNPTLFPNLSGVLPVTGASCLQNSYNSGIYNSYGTTGAYPYGTTGAYPYGTTGGVGTYPYGTTGGVGTYPYGTVGGVGTYPYGTVGGIGTAGGVGTYPYGTTGYPYGTGGAFGSTGTYPYGTGLSQQGGPGCSPAAPIVVDPCYGAAFSQYGEYRFAPPNSNPSPECSPTRVRSADSRPHPPVVPDPAECIRRDGPDRASRGLERPPLRAAEPPPAPGAPPGKGFFVVAPPNSAPQPHVQALVPGHDVPYCDELLPMAGSRPLSGGGSSLVHIVLFTGGVGAAVIAGGLYWRRKAPGKLTYSRR